MSGWLAGWLGGWVDRFVNGWVGGWLYGWIMGRRIDGLMSGWKKGAPSMPLNSRIKNGRDRKFCYMHMSTI